MHLDHLEIALGSRQFSAVQVTVGLSEGYN